MGTSKKLLAASAVLAIVGLIAWRLHSHADDVPQESALPSAPVEPERTKVPIASDDPVRGALAAPVTIVQFCDFHGVPCKQMATTLAQLLESRRNDVRVVWKDRLPQSRQPHASVAALLARKVYGEHGNDAFWSAHDTIFDTLAGLDEPLVQNVGRALGMEDAAALDAVDDLEAQRKITQSAQLANVVGVTVTPHFFVNGLSITGTQTLQQLEALVDAELRRLGSPAVADTHELPYDIATEGARDVEMPEVSAAPGLARSQLKAQRARDARRGVQARRDAEDPVVLDEEQLKVARERGIQPEQLRTALRHQARQQRESSRGP